MTKVAVLGAGVIGLSSALRLRQELPGAEIAVLATEFLTDTTSDGAAGLWEPYKLGDTPADRINAWSGETYQLFQELYDSRDCTHAGITQLPMFSVQTSGDLVQPSWAGIPPDFSRLSGSELARLSRKGGREYTAGLTCTTYMCEGRFYLPYLQQRLKQMGVQLVRRRITSLEGLAHYDIVVNCLGLAARTVVPDSSVVPIRGHVIRVRAPWVKAAYFEDESVYVLPNRDTVVLGGTGQVGDSDMTPRQEDRDHIWSGATRLMPSLSQAEVVREWVGLRPGRSTVRLETELRPVAGRPQPLKIVHNYGHGGAGITLHWGCAAEVVRLVQQLLQREAARSRL